MKRTTIYLPEDLKSDLERVAKANSCSEAEVIRRGIEHMVDELRPRPKPDFPLFDSGGIDWSKDEEMLAGDPERGIPAFGED